MHELALCEQVVQAALAEYSRIIPPPRRLRRVHVIIGGLHQIVPDFFQTAYQLLTRETPVDGSEMELTVAPVTGRCKACGWKGEIRLPFFECGSCHARQIEMLHGTEILLDKLEIEEA